MFHLICGGIKSYVLGEIPSLKDRVTIVRQLWSLTKDVLVTIYLWASYQLFYDTCRGPLII